MFEAGGVLAIAGEGRIHVGEHELLAAPGRRGLLRAALGRPDRARRRQRGIVARLPEHCSASGSARPIPTGGRATSEAVAELTNATWLALKALVADAPEPAVPGRFGRWLTELFNDWPEGSRAASAEVERTLWHTFARPRSRSTERPREAAPDDPGPKE